ncbi:MFS transporter [Caballeronia grimmiae]|uniref:MFS transporter n=1 Tax=Caballeronia grimmiae TaxID=1071679 RepID=UPI0038B83754
MIISFAIVGTALGMLVINKIGRRPLLIAPYVLATLSLMQRATPLSGLATAAIGLFVLFTIAEAAGSGLQFVYPNEVFATDLRATGMGLAMSVSRIGAAAGTFLLPMTLARFGSANGLLIAGAISVVGLLVSVRMAPRFCAPRCPRDRSSQERSRQRRDRRLIRGGSPTRRSSVTRTGSAKTARGTTSTSIEYRTCAGVICTGSSTVCRFVGPVASRALSPAASSRGNSRQNSAAFCAGAAQAFA